VSWPGCGRRRRIVVGRREQVFVTGLKTTCLEDSDIEVKEGIVDGGFGIANFTEIGRLQQGTT
jgi:hypothetical protein